LPPGPTAWTCCSPSVERQVGPFALVEPSQRRCRVCSEPLEARARRDAVYCSGACRMAALRARAA